MPYTEMYLFENKCTTIPATGGWAATTAYPLPDWAPEIAYIGSTTEMQCVRASTSGVITGGLGAAPTLTRLRQVSTKAYLLEEATRNDKKDIWTVIAKYRSVGELVR
ncbi:unnamed protein product [marine sediment metagenome]|uniref:Uncharacterized protein n=1 Tax=marine sediment metagenome TaxID=412755 RepID=X1FPN8_9ZZZZ